MEEKKEQGRVQRNVGPWPITERDPDFAVFDGGEDVIKLDLACGKKKLAGFIGVDKSMESDADIFIDLEQYPWTPQALRGDVSPIFPLHEMVPESSVYEVYCGHFIEHVKDLKAFLEECYRVMKDQSILRILAPYYTSIGAVQDPTHVRSICEYTFNYFDQEKLAQSGLSHYDPNCDFKVAHTRYYFTSEYISKGEEAKRWAVKHQWNVVENIEFHLRVTKPVIGMVKKKDE